MNRWFHGLATVAMILMASTAIAAAPVYNTDASVDGGAQGGKGAVLSTQKKAATKTTAQTAKPTYVPPKLVPFYNQTGVAIANQPAPTPELMPQVFPQQTISTTKQPVVNTTPQVMPAEPEGEVVGTVTAAPLRNFEATSTEESSSDPNSAENLAKDPAIAAAATTTMAVDENGIARVSGAGISSLPVTAEVADTNTEAEIVNSGMGALPSLSALSTASNPVTSVKGTIPAIKTGSSSNTSQDQLRGIMNGLMSAFNTGLMSSISGSGSSGAAGSSAAANALPKRSVSDEIAEASGSCMPTELAGLRTVAHASADVKGQIRADRTKELTSLGDSATLSCTQLAGANILNSVVSLAQNSGIAGQFFNNSIMSGLKRSMGDMPIPGAVKNMFTDAVSQGFNSIVGGIASSVNIGGLFGGGGKGMNTSSIDCSGLSKVMQTMSCALKVSGSPIAGSGDSCINNDAIKAIVNFAAGDRSIMSGINAYNGVATTVNGGTTMPNNSVPAIFNSLSTTGKTTTGTTVTQASSGGSCSALLAQKQAGHDAYARCDIQCSRVSENDATCLSCKRNALSKIQSATRSLLDSGC